MPKISIILPTYNVEKYIARALESCINQTLKDIEIIVVDDKGQDRSIEIAKEYAGRDNRIRIVHNEENLKLLHARAEGVKVAASELIMFLDPDDELELNACEILYDKAIEYNGLDLIIYNAISINNQNKETIVWNFECYIKSLELTVYMEEYEKYGWSMWNKVFKKQIYLEVFQYVYSLGFNINMAEDFLFNFFATNIYKNKILVINKILYKYHINNDSMTKKVNFYNINNNIKTYNIIINIIKYFKTKNTNFKIKCLKILKKEKVFYCSNNLKFIKFENLYIFLLYIKYKILKMHIKLFNKL